MINPRFMPGGDKYESIRDDDRRPFYERVQADQSEILDILKSVVSSFTENEWLEGNEPTLERFLLLYEEWDHEELYATISQEMERVLAICELSRSSAEVQGA